MFKCLLPILSILLPAIGAAQVAADTAAKPANRSFEVPIGSSLYSDYLQNFYIVSPNNDISKYDLNGNLLATANFKVLGNISSLDASNPFEIYVFYRDQNRILFLDNLLNLRGECDLETIGVSQIAAVARSADNQIWLFDMADLKLKKYGKDLKLQSESAPFNTLLNGAPVNPSQILDINSSVLVLNAGSLHEFDVFANYGRLLLSDTIQQFQYISHLIVYLKNGQMYAYDKKSFRMRMLNLSVPPGSRMVRIEKETAIILRDGMVTLQTLSEKY